MTELCCECEKHPIANKKYKLCIYCNYKRLHGGKTMIEVQMDRQKTKPIKVYQFKKQPLKRTQKPTKYKRKKTGEWEMFLEIWKERPHYCVNKKCGKYLGEEPQAIFFSHRKSKGAYPELRLCKDNIDLLCPECHRLWDFSNKNEVSL
jgi:hypothetical protein